ncbi:unnamed protein product, partial [Ectocarpus sp. 4 AP-2014]
MMLTSHTEATPAESTLMNVTPGLMKEATESLASQYMVVRDFWPPAASTLTANGVAAAAVAADLVPAALVVEPPASVVGEVAVAVAPAAADFVGVEAAAEAASCLPAVGAAKLPRGSPLSLPRLRWSDGGGGGGGASRPPARSSPCSSSSPPAAVSRDVDGGAGNCGGLLNTLRRGRWAFRGSRRNRGLPAVAGEPLLDGPSASARGGVREPCPPAAVASRIRENGGDCDDGDIGEDDAVAGDSPHPPHLHGELLRGEEKKGLKIEGTSVKLSSSSSSGERACRVEWLGCEYRGEEQV